MSEISNALISEAMQRGACGLLTETMSLPDLAQLLRSPQGREWAAIHDYPTAAALSDIAQEELNGFRIYVNCQGQVNGWGDDFIFAGAETKAVVKISGTEALHHIVALDGAHVRVEASGYAVASIDASDSAEVEIINTDNTARISCRKKEN